MGISQSQLRLVVMWQKLTNLMKLTNLFLSRNANQPISIVEFILAILDIVLVTETKTLPHHLFVLKTNLQ